VNLVPVPAPRLAICPGSFDPMTNGHVELVRRAAALFDRVVIAVLVNDQKTPLLDAATRVELARVITSPLGNVEVETFEGLLVDYAASRGATAVVRGLRSGADFDYEWPMTVMNRRLAPSLETVFLVPAPEVAAISSRLVKEIWKLGGDITGLVPVAVAAHMAGLRHGKAGR
jgi:pantetheine-phosphate adenylyltransferase